jgi:phosphopantothenoylcysteine decarboxylase/phosphopantothenate--cysteine ligase
VDVVKIKSAADMFEAVTSRAPECDLVIKAAAVADYTPATVNEDKTKKKDGDMSIPLVRTQDILKYLGEHKQPGQQLCGFSMETRDMLENSRVKLEKKNADMIVANNLKVSGAGFGTDTNIVTLITRENVEELPIMSKAEVAHAILDKLKAMRTK